VAGQVSLPTAGLPQVDNFSPAYGRQAKIKFMKRVFTQTFGVVGAIIEKEGKILLVKETKKVAKGLWNHPAGWIDVGENPFEAVKREVNEKVGTFLTFI